MSFNKKFKAFSLVEMLIVFIMVSIMLAAFAPAITKRMKRSSDPSCVGGVKTIVWERDIAGNYEFTTPDTIVGNAKITIIGGGAGGSSGLEKTNQRYCSEPEDENTYCHENFEYEIERNFSYFGKMYYTHVGKGKGATCEENALSATGGSSGDTVENIFINTDMGSNYFMDTTGGLVVDMTYIVGENLLQDGTLGRTITTTGTASGGIPSVGVICGGNRNCGIGESAEIKDLGNGVYACSPKNDETGLGAMVKYSEFAPGAGGGAGAYKQFEVELQPSTKYNIEVGAGGFGQTNTIVGMTEENDGTSGHITSIINSTNSSVVGAVNGGSFPENNGSEAGLGGACTDGESGCISGQNGTSNSGTTSIQGGQGGGLKYGNLEHIGGIGGCFGNFTRPSQCSTTKGADGFRGTGGGGGSCSNQGCGAGGNGGNGYVKIEYQVICD